MTPILEMPWHKNFDIDQASLPAKGVGSNPQFLTEIVAFANQNYHIGKYVSIGKSFYLGGTEKVFIGNRVNIGDYSSISTNVDNAEFVPEQRPVYIGDSVFIDPGSRVLGGTILSHGSFLGSNSRIGSDCLIMDANIGNNAKVGKGSTVLGANVPANAFVPDNSEIMNHWHVIFIPAIDLTMARNKDGTPMVRVGCQTFPLEWGPAKIRALASNHLWDLPPGWLELRKYLLAVAKTWQR